MTHRRPYPNDQWTLELETLGFHHGAEELARMALLAEAPFAICVAGRWGSGKTQSHWRPSAANSNGGLR